MHAVGRHQRIDGHRSGRDVRDHVPGRHRERGEQVEAGGDAEWLRDAQEAEGCRRPNVRDPHINRNRDPDLIGLRPRDGDAPGRVVLVVVQLGIDIDGRRHQPQGPLLVQLGDGVRERDAVLLVEHVNIVAHQLVDLAYQRVAVGQRDRQVTAVQRP